MNDKKPDDGRCRYNCRTAKENWIEGFRAAANNTYLLPEDAEEAYDLWKASQK